jgi:uncharacterized membrane protein (UPF0127 family)
MILKISPYFLFLFFLFACNKVQETKNTDIQRTPVALKQGIVKFIDRENSVISEVIVEIAEDEYSRAKGLMDRRHLPENQGMLFVFEKEKYQYFWMKNTPISLDIIYVNQKEEIVSISKYTQPYSTRSYPSTGPAIYVVETNAGYCDRYGIEAGDIIEIKRF